MWGQQKDCIELLILHDSGSISPMSIKSLKVMRQIRRGGTEAKPCSSAMPLGSVMPIGTGTDKVADVARIRSVLPPCARAAEGHVPESPAGVSMKTGSVGCWRLAGRAERDQC